jgi:isoquinoline 1-oxidoreductase beta subunit
MGTLGKITRRSFLVVATAIVGGAAFGFYKYSQPFANPLKDDLAEGEATFNPYVKIASDNTITVIAPRAEMGQGIFTMLGALVAEELDVTLDQITIEHGPASPAYFNTAALEHGAPYPQFDESFTAETVRSAMGVVAKFLAIQLTGGSTSTVDHFEKMRLAGAAAREMLKAAAARKLGVAAESLTTDAGRITDPKSGKSLTYGEVAQDAAALSPPEQLRLRDKSEWKILGKPMPRKDMLAKVTGGRIFGIDIAEADMLHATIRMNPNLGGKLVAIDTSAARSMRGVVKIVEIRSRLGEGYGVIADNTWRAFQAADAVTADWGKAAYPQTSEAIEKELDARLDGETGFALRTVGDPDAILATAPRERVLEAEYFAPFLSHAAMEPMNATARIKDGWLDIWAPHQSPTIVKMIGADVSGLTEDKVRVHITFLGGGFGRRAEPDFIDYAVRLALEVQGKAVKVTWTREEDMTHSPLRPLAKSRYRAMLDDDGIPTAVIGSVSSPSITKSFVGRLYPSIPIGGPDAAMIDGAYNQPYEIANYRIDGRPAELAVPTTFWRSVGCSYNAFMHESFIDEIAATAKKDPLELRRKLMAPYPVALKLIDAIEVMSDWKTPLPKDRARGFAFTLSFGTWVAQVVEISQQEAGIKVEKVYCAADAGAVLDERNFRAQMMSGIVYGLSAAIGQKITFADGAIEQMNFSDHDGMRMYQCPEIEVELLSNSTHMGGAGEPATPPVMPALANAVFALTGQRLRRMPFADDVTFV